MNTLFKAAIAGGAGVMIAEFAQPYVDKYVKPESDFARRAMKIGVGAASTGLAFWALGLVTGK